MITLAGHNALITGSTKGVGQAIACAMAEAGANVVIHGRQMSDAAQQTLDKCREAGVEAEFITGDLSAETAGAVEDLYGQAMAANPNIDILVNNAGTYIDQPFLEMDLETFDKTMKTKRLFLLFPDPAVCPPLGSWKNCRSRPFYRLD